MTRSARIARVSLGLLTLFGATACVLALAFTNTQILVVEQNGTVLSQVKSVDLSGVQEIRDHRDHVRKLDLTSAKITITAVGATNTWVNVTGTVALRPANELTAAHDVQVGALTNFAITKDNTVTFTGTAELNAFALGVIKGNEQFQIVVNGTTTGGQVGSFTISIDARYGLEYET